MTDPISFGVLIGFIVFFTCLRCAGVGSGAQYRQYTCDEEEEYNDISDSHVINIYKHHLKTIFMSSGTKYNKEFKINDINISGEVNKIETNFKLSNYNIPHEILYKIIYNYLKKHKWKTSILLRRILDLNDIVMLKTLLIQVFDNNEYNRSYSLILWFIDQYMNIKHVDTNEITEEFIERIINTDENGEEKTSEQKKFKDFDQAAIMTNGEQTQITNQFINLLQEGNEFFICIGDINIKFTNRNILINDNNPNQLEISYNGIKLTKLQKLLIDLNEGYKIRLNRITTQNFNIWSNGKIIKSILTELEKAHKS